MKEDLNSLKLKSIINIFQILTSNLKTVNQQNFISRITLVYLEKMEAEDDLHGRIPHQKMTFMA
jgi:hypothetical protein